MKKLEFMVGMFKAFLCNSTSNKVIKHFKASMFHIFFITSFWQPEEYICKERIMADSKACFWWQECLTAIKYYGETR